MGVEQYFQKPIHVSSAAVDGYLRSRAFASGLQGILHKTRDFEQGMVVGYSLPTKKFTQSTAKYAEGAAYQAGRVIDKMESRGEIPMAVVHAHTLGHGDSFAWVPSVEDVTFFWTKYLETTSTRVDFNFTMALILPTRSLDVWLWQAPNDEMLKLISFAYSAWQRSIVSEVKGNDMIDLVSDLRNSGLRIVKGKLDGKDLAGSFANLLKQEGYIFGTKNTTVED